MSWTNFFRPVRYETRGLTVTTRGLSRRGQSDIAITVEASDLLISAEDFLRFVVNYLEVEKQTILPHQTMNYGYWVVKFEPASSGLLDVWEYDTEFREFLHGGSLAVRYWRDQLALCNEFHAHFAPPNPGTLTAVSAGVFEGLPVQAVRYSFGDHMSGWIMMTEQYDGNVERLTNHHTYHLTAARPDLAKFLALPPGSRFDLTDGERVCFDEEASNLTFESEDTAGDEGSEDKISKADDIMNRYHRTLRDLAD